MGEMGSLDEALSAMLADDRDYSSNSLNIGVVPVLGDVFASQYSSSLQGSFSGPSAGPKLSSNFGKHGNSPSAPSYLNATETLPAQRPQFARDESKWTLLDVAKIEALEASSVLASGRAGAVNDFRPDPAAPLNLNPPPSGGLQRYHSAPSSFFQCLADFDEDAFSPQVSESPLGPDSDAGLLDAFFADNNLATINERGAQAMDTEKMDHTVSTSTSLNDYEQFLVSSQSTDFGRSSSSLSTSNLAEPRSLTRSDHGHGGYSTPDALGVRSRPSRNCTSNLLRQSSTPADFLAAIQDADSSPTFKVPSFLSRLESGMSPRGGTSETDNVGKLGNSSLRVRVDPGSLIRHSSLPAAGSRPFSPSMELDDLPEFSSTVPCRTRAHRGFATHPRSIAERVRRTKISERMKKLQDLVPNMDRQTNTADMLDEAVEYVKHLQLQVQELSNTVVQLKERLVHCN